ncbi:MAG: helix-turn-helix domain-containing protein [Bacilli bacterium]
MKEIGEKLQDTRESIGVTIEEVAEDLKVRPSEIEEVEKGNIKALKDIFSLKNFIRDYSKYLGLSYDEVIDEFNEYLFDYTSQISLEDIRTAKSKDDSVKKEKKVISPYTMETKQKNKLLPRIIWGLIIILVIVGAYFIYKTVTDDSSVKKPEIKNVLD